MKNYGVNFYQLSWSVFGAVIPVWVGVGLDGSIWVDPVPLRVRPSDLDPSRYAGPFALIDPEVRRIYINARALVEMQIAPRGREAMAVCMERLEARLKQSNLLPNREVQNN